MVFFFIFLFVLLMIASQILSNIKNDREWSEGLFEKEEPMDEIPPHDPLLEAYISLGALMIRKDRSSYKEKIFYLNSYFSRHFPDTHYDFGRSFTDSLKNPVRVSAISRRLRRKLPHKEQRLQIMYFLAGLSNVDGSMNKREIDLLKDISILLKLSTKDFDSIIAIYTQQRKRTQSTSNSKSRISAFQIASKVLGVAENASKDEIKKAYRRLVKLHHPDLFATEPLAHQEIAEKRFIEIQKAYELFETRWK